MQTLDLFAGDAAGGPRAPIVLGPGTRLLPGFVREHTDALLQQVDAVLQEAPLRQMVTPGGLPMAVRTSNCGALGWISDRHGYRYSAVDPLSGRAWPAMPPLLATLGREAALAAGFARFEADACLINRYEPGTRLSLHQDRDERDFHAPIVSVSLGMEATFLLGGARRADRPQRITLHHGDVLVWGAEDRLRFHGVAPLHDRPHPLLGRQRINLTLRKAG